MANFLETKCQTETQNTLIYPKVPVRDTFHSHCKLSRTHAVSPQFPAWVMSYSRKEKDQRQKLQCKGRASRMTSCCLGTKGQGPEWPQLLLIVTLPGKQVGAVTDYMGRIAYSGMVAKEEQSTLMPTTEALELASSLTGTLLFREPAFLLLGRYFSIWVSWPHQICYHVLALGFHRLLLEPPFYR